MSTILFVGGGSVGHIAPAIAVWNELKKIEPTAKAHFVCSERPDDAAFLSAFGLPFTIFRAPRLSISFPFKFHQAKREANRILSTLNPDVIFSKGGYVSVPICLAAKKKGIPIILHESDTIGGRANKIVGAWAEKICTGFPIEMEKAVHTGNPVRSEITNGSKDAGLDITGFTGEKPILMVIGGSQGAQAINEAVKKLLPKLLGLCDIIHITGRGKNVATDTKGYWSRPFVNEELPHLYACASLALSRSGAGSIGELAANGIPAILVPLRGVGHDHQQKNAEHVESVGACLLIQQDKLESKLFEIVQNLVEDKAELQELSSSIKKLHNPDSAKKIANIILEDMNN